MYFVVAAGLGDLYAADVRREREQAASRWSGYRSVHKAFESMDTDGNGFVTRAELWQWWRPAGSKAMAADSHMQAVMGAALQLQSSASTEGDEAGDSCLSFRELCARLGMSDLWEAESWSREAIERILVSLEETEAAKIHARKKAEAQERKEKYQQLKNEFLAMDKDGECSYLHGRPRWLLHSFVVS